MRSAILAATLLAALLAVPGSARAQVAPNAGQVTFENAFIGADGCSSTSTSNTTVRIAWLDQVDTANAASNPSTAGVFRIYATNTAPVASASGAQYCQTVNNPNATTGQVFAAQVGSDIPNTGLSLSGVASAVSETAIAQAAGFGSCTQDGQNIFVCVHFYPYAVGGGTQPQGTATAWAVGTMTLSLSRPGAITLDQVLPGNGALNVYWSDHNASQAAKYKIRALSLLDPTLLPTAGDFGPSSAYAMFDPRDPSAHETGFITGTGPYRMAGLVNYVAYAVAVVPFSAAETAGDPSNIVSSEPQVVSDFWQTYKAAGGREAGGCSSGVAGPIGLGLLIATLALVRRRK